MKAKQLVRQRVEISATRFAELVVWQLPKPLEGSAHNFKYRLAFVVDGECVIRYDNEAGKGDHRHLGLVEMGYKFKAARQLMADFFNDIQRYNHAHPDD
jgi:Family of unknown function (DUF6516)